MRKDRDWDVFVNDGGWEDGDGDGRKDRDCDGDWNGLAGWCWKWGGDGQ